MEACIRSTQEQAVAAWVDHLNQLRLDRLVTDLFQQDQNMENALRELAKVKEFVGSPEHILGSSLTKHGEIAEHMQVNFSNARKMIDGFLASHDIESVGRTAPEDYLRYGQQIQSKFLHDVKATLNGSGSANGIRQHLEKYPFFVKNGGGYDIPKDQYEEICRVLRLRATHPTQLNRTELRLLDAIDSFQKDTGLQIGRDVHPSVVSYQDVQQGKAVETIADEEKSIRQRDKENRHTLYENSKPTGKEAQKAAVVGAVSEGGVAFCLAVAAKRKSGKKLSEFTAQDWVDVGLDTGKSTMKGGIRGGSVYVLSNFTATPACVASALVTAIFGVMGQANAMRKGEQDEESFLINSEAVCMDVTISAIASVLGQMVIPLPVLGAVIGNTVGMFLYEITKKCHLEKEQRLIKYYHTNLQCLDSKLEQQYQVLLAELKEHFRRFSSLLDFAFDPDINRAFEGSIALARVNGVPEEKLLKSVDEIDAFFLS